ncbi:GNAT family N-acetyltransferase [Sphingobacterium psychroaquaticum]|uniref:GNAT family N-acetyltransferase n=1 Tax=Sphingobacterium psychroaquaticum TaxID=561061 RepID=UPI00106A6048|nr:GNAT family N-acetyltransferase [Sphingobacterium psychroaquaticum]QBQ41811.1 GNAT family N-acetyltransferase [Sphingobacterium psychroaquaticum]
MIEKEVYISNDKYNLRIGYQEVDHLRAELNRMSMDFWGFDFENYYQSGYWDKTCILYSLFDGDQMVAHTTLSILETTTGGEVLQLGQIGTVMTAANYQRKGLARFLMEEIQHDYQDVLDGYFLFANETVLDFYPKFGFTPVAEYQPTLSILSGNTPANKATRLNLDLETDRLLFERYVTDTKATSRFYTRNFGLTFFYCYAYPDFGFKDAIYFLPQLDTVVVAQYEEDTLHVFEIFQKREVSLREVIQILATRETRRVVFGFTPQTDLPVDLHQYKEEDLTLFVTERLVGLFTHEKLMVPLLSHT